VLNFLIFPSFKVFQTPFGGLALLEKSLALAPEEF